MPIELFSRIASFDNLLSAAVKARKGKRFHEDVAMFNLGLEKELFALNRDLLSGEYRPGKYRQFYVREKEIRLISAAPYRDRVVHHAVMNVLEPILSRSFIYDSYANRVGKGTHRAINRFQRFMVSSKYLLKIDIRKYFHSIDHEILIAMLEERVGDERTLRLLRLIIETSPPQEPVAAYFQGDDLLTPAMRRRGSRLATSPASFLQIIIWMAWTILSRTV